MRIIRPFVLLLVLASTLEATNPEFGIILQPANLVGDSLPGCIPLTASIAFHNYRFGLHRTISAARPFLHGAKEWKKGTESNHNLASVFGIQVDPRAMASGTFEPIEIHIKDWPTPAYSPHTKAEVLAATVHCLLAASLPSPEVPLEIQIVTENKADEEWAKPFAGKYIVRPGKDNKPVVPTPVGNSILTIDDFGIRHVISPRKNPSHLTPKVKPVILPAPWGDGRGRPIPVWPGTRLGKTDPPNILQCFAIPRSHFYNLFGSGSQFAQQFNPFFQKDHYFSLKSSDHKDFVLAQLTISDLKPGSLASGIAAMAMTARLHHDKPLKVAINFYTQSKIGRELADSPHWTKKGTKRGAVSAIFDYDPKTKTLIKGNLPSKMIITPGPLGEAYFKMRTE